MGAELYDYFGLQKSSELFLQLMRAQYDESCRTFKHVENCYLECQKQLNVSEEKYNRLLAENQDLIATVEDLTNTNVALKDFIDKIQKEKMTMLKQLDATQSKVAELKQIAKNLQQPQNTIINDEAEAERYLQLLNKERLCRGNFHRRSPSAVSRLLHVAERCSRLDEEREAPAPFLCRLEEEKENRH